MTNAELKAIVQREEYDFLRTNKHLGSNILFLTLSGSHAYGTNVEGSDIDIRGVAGSPEILGLTTSTQALTIISIVGTGRQRRSAEDCNRLAFSSTRKRRTFPSTPRKAFSLRTARYRNADTTPTCRILIYSSP